MTERTVDLHADIGDILLTEAEIAAKVAELGPHLRRLCAAGGVTLVSVLKGSLPFMADLMRAIDLPLRIDLMEVSSYGGTATESSGLVRILKDLSASIEDEDVLIVEDIIDTGPDPQLPDPLPARQEPGVTAHLHPAGQARPPAGGDPGRLRGFTIPDQFVVGYGLDYGEVYRNLRFVGVLRPEVYGAGRPRRPTARDDASPAAGEGRTIRRSAASSSSSAASCPGGRSAATRAARRERQRPRGERHPRLPARCRDPGPGRPAVRDGDRPTSIDRWYVSGSWP